MEMMGMMAVMAVGLVVLVAVLVASRARSREAQAVAREEHLLRMLQLSEEEAKAAWEGRKAAEAREARVRLEIDVSVEAAQAAERELRGLVYFTPPSPEEEARHEARLLLAEEQARVLRGLQGRVQHVAARK